MLVTLQVFDYDLQRQLIPYMKDIKPLPGIYDPNFIAANQAARADNLIPGTKSDQVSVVRDQLKKFKSDNGLDKIIVLWTANTERYAEIKEGLNDTEGGTYNCSELCFKFHLHTIVHCVHHQLLKQHSSFSTEMQQKIATRDLSCTY